MFFHDDKTLTLLNEYRDYTKVLFVSDFPARFAFNVCTLTLIFLLYNMKQRGASPLLSNVRNPLTFSSPVAGYFEKQVKKCGV